MNIRLGEKIRSLRKAKNISQEILAQYLGVSFQAVSKWENGSTMPDVTLLPAIASFFEISIDELFDFNTLETERKVQQMCWDIAEFRDEDPAKAERMLRDLLKQYPGNDIILNNLIYTIRSPDRRSELIDLCRTIIASTKYDDVRYDAARIMAETYKAMGEYTLCKEAINLIPEFFFTHREEKALLLDGEDMFRPAWQQKEQSAETFVEMTLRLTDYYEEAGELDKAQRQLELAASFIQMMADDEVPPFWKENFYESYGKDTMQKIKKRMASM